MKLQSDCCSLTGKWKVITPRHNMTNIRQSCGGFVATERKSHTFRRRKISKIKEEVRVVAKVKHLARVQLRG